MLNLQGEDFSVQYDAEIAIRVIAFTQKSFGLDSKFVFQPNLANISPELWRIKATSENDLRDFSEEGKSTLTNGEARSYCLLGFEATL